MAVLSTYNLMMKCSVLTQMAPGTVLLACCAEMYAYKCVSWLDLVCVCC